MPSYDSPGTPSWANGSRMPCQWIELVTGKRFVTRSVTVSPSRQDNSGAGTVPLTAVAKAVLPVMRTGTWSIVRSNSVPDRTVRSSAVAATPRPERRPRPAARPASPTPVTKRRRELACVGWRIPGRAERERKKECMTGAMSTGERTMTQC